jgi:hypothetical protein
VPNYYSFGNGKTTIGYTANGEASDWMLAEHGVYAISPELGTDNPQSDYFFIYNTNVLKEVMEVNIDWMMGTYMRLLDREEITL